MLRLPMSCSARASASGEREQVAAPCWRSRLERDGFFPGSFRLQTSRPESSQQLEVTDFQGLAASVLPAPSAHKPDLHEGGEDHQMTRAVDPERGSWPVGLESNVSLLASHGAPPGARARHARDSGQCFVNARST